MKWLKKRAELDNLNLMIDFIMEHLNINVKVTQHIDMEVRLLCEETLMNIITHAYPNKHSEMYMYAGYEYDEECECIVLKICDHGIPFNPLKSSDPVLSGEILEREIGGLGIFLIKKISDVIEYERKDGMNILTIKKYYQPKQLTKEEKKESKSGSENS